jgi:hypothetical protein
VNGNWNAWQRRWEWTDANAIPGARFSASGDLPNVLAFYSQMTPSDPFELDSTVNFNTSLNVPDPCFSGSGSNSMLAESARRGARTYPAVWLVAASGFSVPALALFNATWGLRQVASATHPTWDNAADGKSAPRVQLKLCPKNGWELALHFRDAQVSYVLPFQGNPFGPLSFGERQEVLPGLGAVALPMILVSAT